MPAELGYLIHRISQSIRARRSRTRRWHCTAPRSGRSRSAGSPPHSAAPGSLWDQGTVVAHGQQCPGGKQRCWDREMGSCSGFFPLQLVFTLLTSGTDSSRRAKAVSGDVVAGGPFPTGTRVRAVLAVAASGAGWQEEDLYLPSSNPWATCAGQKANTWLCCMSRAFLLQVGQCRSTTAPPFAPC